MMFGTDDDLTCLAGNFKGPAGEQVCLASKISLHFFVAGVHVSDGGYVLKIEGARSYYPLSTAGIAELQQAQLVPTPLPAYHIGLFQYAIGYSLWLILLGMFIAAGLKRIFGKLRPFLAAPTAPVTGPPALRTDGDRWLTAELAKHLEPGEALQHQAACANHEPGTMPKGAKLYVVGLTDRRLLFLETKRGFETRKGRETEIVDVFARGRETITAVGQNALVVGFDFSDGSGFALWILGSQRAFTNQWLFARDVPRLVERELARRLDTPRCVSYSNPDNRICRSPPPSTR